MWLLAAAVVMATGIWAMHFTGMLAAEFPIPVVYDAALIAASALPAVLAGLICLVVLKKPYQKAGLARTVCDILDQE